jgi:phosphoadenosine phosphosulfate reductase
MPLHLADNTPAGGIPPEPRRAAAERVAALNARFRRHGATAVLDAALRDRLLGRVALVSSFGAEAAVLLHLVAITDPGLPVLFIDTDLHFTETLVYQLELAERLALRDVRVIRAGALDIARADPSGTLHATDPDACCALRKSAPLARALDGFDGWITGRKRFQGGTRAALDFFEADPDTDRIKLNPLAHWGPEDIAAYADENRLPRHPLVARGYPSIGCAPCTAPAAADAPPRAGRWQGRAKTECGIHFAGGRPARTGEKA